MLTQNRTGGLSIKSIVFVAAISAYPLVVAVAAGFSSSFLERFENCSRGVTPADFVRGRLQRGHSYRPRCSSPLGAACKAVAMLWRQSGTVEDGLKLW
jgi:hypothetical protein